MKRNAASARFTWVLPIILGMTSLVWGQQQSTISGDAAASRIAWWREAKFGLFMHWGVYSIPARGEWVQWNEQIPVNEYAKLAGQFHPDKFDPDAWAAIAKAAGMKYTVLTSRHHDGFALFDDPGSNFTAMKSGGPPRLHRRVRECCPQGWAARRSLLFAARLAIPRFLLPRSLSGKRRGDARAVSSPTQRTSLSLRQDRCSLV